MCTYESKVRLAKHLAEIYSGFFEDYNFKDGYPEKIDPQTIAVYIGKLADKEIVRKNPELVVNQIATLANFSINILCQIDNFFPGTIEKASKKMTSFPCTIGIPPALEQRHNALTLRFSEAKKLNLPLGADLPFKTPGTIKRRKSGELDYLYKLIFDEAYVYISFTKRFSDTNFPFKENIDNLPALSKKSYSKWASAICDWIWKLHKQEIIDSESLLRKTIQGRVENILANRITKKISRLSAKKGQTEIEDAKLDHEIDELLNKKEDPDQADENTLKTALKDAIRDKLKKSAYS